MVAGMGLEPSSRLSQVETVLWRGRPRAAWYVARLWWPAALLAAVVLAFGAGWEWLALRAHYLVAYPLGGTLFLALGVYGLALRPLLLLRVARRMVYTVTDRRVVWEWGPQHGCVARERARSVSDRRESATSVGDERARERSAGDGRESATSTAAARRTMEFRLDTLPPWFVVPRRRGTTNQGGSVSRRNSMVRRAAAVDVALSRPSPADLSRARSSPTDVALSRRSLTDLARSRATHPCCGPHSHTTRRSVTV